MKKQLPIFLLFLLFSPYFIAAQTVSKKLKTPKNRFTGIPKAENVRLEQKIVDKTLEVYYDLPEDLGKPYVVSFELFKKSDKTFKVTPKTLTGNAGWGYFSGKNNKIVWHYLIDFPDGFPSALDYYVRVYVTEPEADIPTIREQKRRASEWHAAVTCAYSPFPKNISILGINGLLRFPIGRKLGLGLQANYLIPTAFPTQNYFLIDKKERNEFQMKVQSFSAVRTYANVYYKLKQRLLKDEVGLQLGIPLYSLATFHFSGDRTRFLNITNSSGNAFYQKDSVWNFENAKVSGSMNDLNLGLYYRKLLSVKRNMGFYTSLLLHFYPKQSFHAAQTDAILGNWDKSKYNQVLTGTLLGTNSFSQADENKGEFKTRTAPFGGISFSLGVTF